MNEYRTEELSRHYEIMEKNISYDIESLYDALNEALYKSMYSDNPITVIKVVSYTCYLGDISLGVKRDMKPIRTYKNGEVITQY